MWIISLINTFKIMMTFTTTILGCGSAMPNKHHMPSCQYVQYDNSYFICDAGEGLQYQIDKVHHPISKLKGIFITHMHGDHLFGLIGFLMNIGITGRHTPLDIWGPGLLEIFIRHQIAIMCPNLKYEIHFHIVSGDELLYDKDNIMVESVTLNHKGDTFGYIFREKPRLSYTVDVKKIKKAGIDVRRIGEMKRAVIENPEAFIDIDGTEYKCADFIYPSEKYMRSFAYCTDNHFDPELETSKKLIEKLKNVNLLYHEASFMKSEISKAIEYGHSTAEAAGMLAKLAGVKKLIIGHLSARYGYEEDVLEEARKIFPNTVLANEFVKYEIK